MHIERELKARTVVRQVEYDAVERHFVPSEQDSSSLMYRLPWNAASFFHCHDLDFSRIVMRSDLRTPYSAFQFDGATICGFLTKHKVDDGSGLQVAAPLRVNGLVHVADVANLRGRNAAEDVAVKMERGAVKQPDFGTISRCGARRRLI